MADLYLFEGGGLEGNSLCCAGDIAIPDPCCKIGFAAHNYASERADCRRIEWGEAVAKIIKDNPPEVDDFWITHLLPIDSWQKFVTVRMKCRTEGLVFRVESVGVIEQDGKWVPDEADTTVLIPAVDLGTYDEENCAVNRIGYAYAPPAFMTEMRLLRIVFTAVPANMFSECERTGLGFEISIVDTDPCFMDQYGGVCGKGGCSDFVE